MSKNASVNCKEAEILFPLEISFDISFDCKSEKTHKRDVNTWKSRVVMPADAHPARRGEIEESTSIILPVWFDSKQSKIGQF